VPPKQRHTYSYSRLSKTDLLFMRIGGDGLGNLLFNWARCLSRSRRHGWRMVWPTWFSYKPKNWRVNPYDVRTYHNLFRPTADYQTGLRKLFHLAFRKWISENEPGPPRPGRLVQFRGMAGKFEPFRDDLQLIRTELLAMTRPQHLTGYLAEDPAPVGLHVRLGDFVQQSSYEDMVAIDNSALPLSWYAAALEAVREQTGTAVRACVFSDGENEELAQLLSMINVERADFGSSIADMLALSRSRLLIASGSTFGQWASYLGQVPTIWHPGKLDQSVMLDRPDLELEWTAGEALPDWVSAVVSADPVQWPRQGVANKGHIS
jgi:hypothetical protein